MRARHLLLILAGSLAAAAAAQPALVCPTAPAGRSCDAYHFHVQMYRVDNKQWVEIFGTNQFASQAACDRARDLYIANNTKAIDHLRTLNQQVERDRVGPCHCDMTTDKASPNYLSDQQRVTHYRTAEELRLRLRERLLDEKVPADSEIVRGLWIEPPLTPQLGGPKLVPLPAEGAPVQVLTATEDLKATKTIEIVKPTVAALDLPLAEIGAPPPPAPVADTVTEPVTNGETAATGTTPPETDAPVASNGTATTSAQGPVTSGPVTPEPVTTPPAEEEEVVAPPPPAPTPAEVAAETTTIPEEDFASAQETAEQFVSYEFDRITTIVAAASNLADETVKSQIIAASQERAQLLSNLRLLIQGSGMRSRLAAAAREARQESERLALVAKLFGNDVTPHWAPADATDAIFEIDPAIAAEPERVLRDTTGAYTIQQKKQALYVALTRPDTTESQRLWLGGIVEDFLR